MPNDRGVGQYLPEEVATEARARYEAHHALEQNDYLFGGLLSSGSLIRDLGTGASTNLVIENAADSPVYYDVKPAYVTNGRSSAQKFLNVDVTSYGSELAVAQQRSDFDNNVGNITVTVDTTIDTTNARVFPERLASTERSSGIRQTAESLLIAPGDNAAIRIRNIGNQAMDATIYLGISPIPVNLIDTLTDGPSG